MLLINTNVQNYILLPPNVQYNESFATKLLSKNGIFTDINIVVSPIKYSNGYIVSKKLSIIDMSSHLDINPHFIWELFKNCRDIIYRLEIFPEFKFTYLSPSDENILGYSLDDHYKNPYLPISLAHPGEQTAMLAKFNGESDFSKPRTIRHKHKDGHYIYLEDFKIPIYDENCKLIVIQ